MNYDHVWLIDASALIQIKQVGQRAQWSLLRQLEDMVGNGDLAFPRQIKDEVSEVMHPDAPGVWAAGVFESMKHPKEPGYEYTQRVMSSPAKAVVDPTKAKEDGDPYLLALALELINGDYDVCIVTNDQRTNPTRMSMSDAADILAIPWCGFADFLSRCRLPGRK